MKEYVVIDPYRIIGRQGTTLDIKAYGSHEAYGPYVQELGYMQPDERTAGSIIR